MNKEIILTGVGILILILLSFCIGRESGKTKIREDNIVNTITSEIYKDTELTDKEYYILASIIEAEAHRKANMPKISAVFHNRLNRDIKLQSCATVNFVRQVNGLPFKLWLSEKDTEIRSPYNTYLYYGLPPMPICIPSKEAIEASYNPYPDTKLLFFRYDKERNGEVFSYTYDQHRNGKKL